MTVKKKNVLLHQKMLRTTCTLIILFTMLISIVYKTRKFRYKTNLQFIHIPKNAGTTIENIGNKHNVKWGRFNDDLETQSKFKQCNYWHIPPKYFNKNSYYDSNDTFCVIRNPFSRIVSEYKYRFGDEPTKLTAKSMNMWIQQDLPFMLKTKKHSYNCHLLPQSEFIYDQMGNKTCTHVLNNDKLTDEFNDLMKTYRYDHIQMTSQKDNVSKGGLSVNDLDENSKAIIRDLYQNDFAILDKQ